jgi:hypothetical protein
VSASLLGCSLFILAGISKSTSYKSNAPLDLARVVPHLVLRQNITPPPSILPLPPCHGPTIPSQRDVQPVVLRINYSRDGARAGIGGFGQSGEELLGIRSSGRGLEIRGTGEGREEMDGSLADILIELEEAGDIRTEAISGGETAYADWMDLETFSGVHTLPGTQSAGLR